MSFNSADYAAFFAHAVPVVERAAISDKDWPTVERNCRRAYNAFRHIAHNRDYVSAARDFWPTNRHRAKLNPSLVHVLNVIGHEIFEPTQFAELDEGFLSE